MKYLLMLDTPFWLVLSASLSGYVFRLRKRMAGLNDPRLYLSKAERRAWARKQLEQDEYERNLGIVRGDSTNQGETA